VYGSLKFLGDSVKVCEKNVGLSMTMSIVLVSLALVLSVAVVGAVLIIFCDAGRWMLLGGCVVLSLIAGAVAALLMHARVGKSVATLIGFIEKISSGEYGAALNEEFGGEFARLGCSVQGMVTQLKEKLGFSQGILEGLPLSICVVDPDQRITFLNQECMDMMESTVRPEEYYGKKLSQIFYKDDRDALILQCMQDNEKIHNREAKFTTDKKREITVMANLSPLYDLDALILQCMQDNEKIHNREAKFTTDKKREITVMANLSPLYDLDGNLIGGFCMYLDMTELKEREAQIIEQNNCISAAADNAGGISDRLAASAEQLSRSVQAAREGAGVQRERAAETATAMDEMNATVSEVARHAVSAADSAEMAKEEAQGGSRVVEEVISAILEVENDAKLLKSSMEQLGVQAEEIGKVLTVIEDIADQTNLLALNAAIEAARAGEAGRGFAVVADEVRKLAEKTMQATSEVGAAIGSIQDGAQESVRATEMAVESVERSTGLAHRSGEALERIVAEADATADRVRSIAAAAEQQSAASEEINRATLEVSRISQDTDEEMQSATSAVGELSDLAESLMKLINSMHVQEA